MTEEIRIEFDDGSVFASDNKYWKQAMLAKGEDNGMGEKLTLEYIELMVNDYWSRERVLTKFGDELWEREYKNKSELCEDCLYGWIRAYLFAVAFEMIGKKCGKKITVVVPTETGIDEITIDGRKHLREDDCADRSKYYRKPLADGSVAVFCGCCHKLVDIEKNLQG